MNPPFVRLKACASRMSKVGQGPTASRFDRNIDGECGGWSDDNGIEIKRAEPAAVREREFAQRDEQGGNRLEIDGCAPARAGKNWERLDAADHGACLCERQRRHLGGRIVEHL